MNCSILMDKINTFPDKTLAHVEDPIMLPFKSDKTRMEEFVSPLCIASRTQNNPLLVEM